MPKDLNTTENKLPTAVSRALKSCQKELKKVEKATKAINEFQRPEDVPKRKLNDFARWKNNLFGEIAALREAARTHDVMTVAWNFIEDNKADLIACFGQDSEAAHMFVTQYAAPEALSSTEANGILNTHKNTSNTPAEMPMSTPGIPVVPQMLICAPAQTPAVESAPSEPRKALAGAEAEHCAPDIIDGADVPGLHPPQPIPSQKPPATFSASETRDLVSPVDIQAPRPDTTPGPQLSAPVVETPQVDSITPATTGEKPQHDTTPGPQPSTPVAKTPQVDLVAPATTGEALSLAAAKRHDGSDKKNKRKQAPDTDSDEGGPARVNRNKKKRQNRSKGKASRSKKDISSGESDSDHSEDDESTNDSDSEPVSSKKGSRKRKRRVRKSKKLRKRTKKSETDYEDEDSSDEESSETGSSGESDTSKEGKTNAKKTKDVKYRDLDEEKKRKKEDEAKKAVRRFLIDPLETQIDVHIRRLIRENQSVVPEAGATSRELALECLTTQQFNVFCPYHHTIDKGGKIVDGKAGQKFVLNGVPLPRKTVSPETIKKLKKKKSLFRPDGQFRNARVRKGYLNCGCSLDAGLWDLYLWKTLTITGVVDGKEVTESMGDQRLTPRVRAFMIKAIEDMACLTTIDDLYTGDKNISPYEHKEKMLYKQLERIMEKYNEVATRLDRPKLMLVDDGEMKVPGPSDEFSSF
ncbi:hypothetical protein F5887DRAFT_1286524 [Amanita rubescens]|nr:hypothetical protein F5887DRAFT_1286524 [Amanita rubescens]